VETRGRYEETQNSENYLKHHIVKSRSEQGYPMVWFREWRVCLFNLQNYIQGRQGCALVLRPTQGHQGSSGKDQNYDCRGFSQEKNETFQEDVAALTLLI
tara:strand:- start:424 stop:723 length:300 start_codon:yes stop_codon:yes gene_type:complete